MRDYLRSNIAPTHKENALEEWGMGGGISNPFFSRM